MTLSHLFNRYPVNLQRFFSSRSRLSLNICKLVLKCLDRGNSVREFITKHGCLGLGLGVLLRQSFTIICISEQPLILGFLRVPRAFEPWSSRRYFRHRSRRTLRHCCLRRRWTHWVRQRPGPKTSCASAYRNRTVHLPENKKGVATAALSRAPGPLPLLHSCPPCAWVRWVLPELPPPRICSVLAQNRRGCL